ncbi:MAG: SPOR domain-containing protein [Pseudomonadota bacterium]|nr:SPOR domain-containing protein [Pseudomonadota bacterium]MEC8262400.1 SPOR domain-containing protein [Pseudomonadota bacterium]
MARQAAERRGPRWLRTILIGLVVICGLGAAAIIVPPMLLAPSADVALIKADPGPIKVKPADPGGAKIPHQETTVMGMIGGIAQTDEDVEILRPPSVVPEMPPTTLPEAETADEPVAPKPAASEAETSGAEAGQSQGAAAQVAAPSATEGETKSGEAQLSGREASGPAAAAGEDDGSSKVAAIEMPTAKPKPPKRIAVEGDDPLYLVQLAAFRDAAKAREQAGLLNGKHRDRLDGAELGTMKHDNGDDGVFWRVVSEPLPRVEADSICTALKRAGQDCILRKFDRTDG